jgi:hypothetical protein
MLCSDPLDYPSDGWLTELTILANPLSLALLLDYSKARSLPDHNGRSLSVTAVFKTVLSVLDSWLNCPCDRKPTATRRNCLLTSCLGVGENSWSLPSDPAPNSPTPYSLTTLKRDYHNPTPTADPWLTRPPLLLTLQSQLSILNSFLERV